MRSLSGCRPLSTIFRVARARHALHPSVSLRYLNYSATLLAQNQNAFANTLLLPKTSFPLWADPAQREEPYRNRTTEELYHWQVSGALKFCAAR